MPGPVRDKSEPFQQLESILLRQMLQASGAFKAGATPGAQLRTDMFVETLADAVAKAGGLGIARMLERQLGGGQGAAGADANSPPAASAAPSAPLSSGTYAGAAAHHSLGRAPRPSSPLAPAPGVGAPSSTSPYIDIASASASRAGQLDRLEDPNNDAPLPEDPTADSIDDYQPRPSALPAISRGRALNRYRERVEDKLGGTSFSASIGEEP